MILIWLKRAGKHLDDIYSYQSWRSEKVATELFNKLIDAAESLTHFPQMGRIEPALEDNPKCYRFLIVEKHYKLIYRIDRLKLLQSGIADKIQVA